MAITNNGTKNSLKDGQIPTGYTKPTVTEFTDEEYVNELDLIVPKISVENASNSITMAGIISAITTQIDAILAGDYIATQTVDAWADLISLSTNLKSSLGDADWLNNSAVNYIAKVKLYVKTA